ncbi:MAG: NAD(P)H-hydrate epimerase [Eubacteriales bacterium]|jgi:NAD(P)H-hydrate epimerase|nr:NAD(P)H-hydrate epimerase [Eubacteriales bacterium]NLO62373.1 NAD(P)H-hydrate epimerase [Clostridiaceae bacterium]
MKQPDNPFWPQKSILNPAPPKEPFIPVRCVRNTLTREEQRSVDRVAVKKFEVPLVILMEHAGLAVADISSFVAGATTTPIHIFAGRGNNGGDAYVCARLLHSRGFSVIVWDCFPGVEHTGAVQIMRESVRLLGIRILPADAFDPQKLRSGVSRMIDEKVSGIPCVIVDGILGTGYEYTRPLPPYLQAITAKIEEAHTRGARVVAVDIPTGVDADTAEADPHAVAADCTVTFILPKYGMTRGKGKEMSGQIRIFPLGLPINFADIALGTPR